METEKGTTARPAVTPITPALAEEQNERKVADSSVLDKIVEQPVAPDQFDDQYRTTKWEIWAYYAWVINGISRCGLTEPCV